VRTSAGLLLYRTNHDGELEVLLVHPGGPFWAKKDDAAWSIPKGEYESTEDPHAAALREFAEELGSLPPDGQDSDLGTVRQSSAKSVVAFAREGNFDATSISSNLIEIDWPPRSGRKLEIPEVDRADWFDLETARRRLVKGQVPFLDRLLEQAQPPGSPQAFSESGVAGEERSRS
jgi:predicted NUDIX family NTP pyrophosphohydrolase